MSYFENFIEFKFLIFNFNLNEIRRQKKYSKKNL